MIGCGSKKDAHGEMSASKVEVGLAEYKPVDCFGGCGGAQGRHAGMKGGGGEGGGGGGGGKKDDSSLACWESSEQKD